MRDVLRISIPFTLWLVSFSALYGLHGLVCSERWPASLGPGAGTAALAGAAILAIGLQAACIFALRAPQALSPLPGRLVQILAVAALFAMVWTAVPVIMTSACI